jgi:hypothetical protein
MKSLQLATLEIYKSRNTNAMKCSRTAPSKFNERKKISWTSTKPNPQGRKKKATETITRETDKTL